MTKAAKNPRKQKSITHYTLRTTHYKYTIP